MVFFLGVVGCTRSWADRKNPQYQLASPVTELCVGMLYFVYLKLRFLFKGH